MQYQLTTTEINQFITEGYIRIDNAFPETLASEVREILWRDIPFDRYKPQTWSEPVVRLGMYTQQPFVESLNTPHLHSAFDQLVGSGNWLPCKSVGTFPVRFPTAKQPMDTGLHVDAGFPGDDPGDYFSWRINVRSRGRGLLILALYSDVSEADAPTLIYKGSHRIVARLLEPEGDRGLSFIELAENLEKLTWGETISATGKAGTVYLCHPLLVHAAQAHTGNEPRFLAQPPLLIKGELDWQQGEAASTPVAEAIRLALQ